MRIEHLDPSGLCDKLIEPARRIGMIAGETECAAGSELLGELAEFAAPAAGTRRLAAVVDPASPELLLELVVGRTD